MTTPSGPSVEALAAGEIDSDDLNALARMADLYTALDPVPPSLVERVQFGITLDALHAEIAQLQRTGGLVGARADEVVDAQTITFTTSSVTTTVTITSTAADRVRIDGWIAPGAGMRVALRQVDGERETVADEDGRFVFEDVPRGLAQFVLRPADGGTGSAVVTPSLEF